jgi:hypothetical protein
MSADYDIGVTLFKANWIKSWNLIIKQPNIEGRDNPNYFHNQQKKSIESKKKNNKAESPIK